jgi:hypothetical protein
MNIFEKMLRRITRKSWNKTIHRIVLLAEKNRTINSYQMHEILGMWNSICFPEREHASSIEKCSTCKGSGVYRGHVLSMTCPDCDGTGLPKVGA